MIAHSEKYCTTEKNFFTKLQMPEVRITSTSWHQLLTLNLLLAQLKACYCVSCLSFIPRVMLFSNPRVKVWQAKINGILLSQWQCNSGEDKTSTAVYFLRSFLGQPTEEFANITFRQDTCSLYALGEDNTLINTHRSAHALLNTSTVVMGWQSGAAVRVCMFSMRQCGFPPGTLVSPTVQRHAD